MHLKLTTKIVGRYFEYKKALIFNGEHHCETKLSKDDAISILKNSNALLLRNTYNFDNTTNRTFWYIIKDSFNNFEELKSRTRNKVRHAFKFFDIRKLTEKEIKDSTYDVYLKAFKSYRHTTDQIQSRKDFTDNIVKENEFWGCIDKKSGKLIAYSENIIRKESCEFRTLKANPEYLSKGYYPFYGLIYRMCEYYLKEKQFKYVSDGSRTITQHSEIQNFLIKNFNFRKAYTNINIYYKPMLGIVINILYHFRRFIPQSKIKSLLRQDEMRRLQKY